ncbi:MAG TPA: O-antigen ligase family protein [Candidatus Binatia bacterium]
MTASSVPFSAPTRRVTRGVERFPVWAIFATVAAGCALGAAAFFSDHRLVLAMAVVGMVFAGLLVLYKPHVGVMVIMTTMLMSYPSALKGVGPFTINNLLGLSLLLILAFQLYRTHDYWFLREPEIRLLIAIAIVLITMQYINKLIWPDIKYLLPKVQKSGHEGYYGEVDVSGRWIFELLSRIAFTIFFVNWIRTPKQLKWVLYVIALCIVAVVPTLGPDMVKGEAEYRITSKVVGWASNINRFAFMMNVGIALFVYLATNTRSVAMRIVWLSFAVGSIPLVLLTASRSGFLGLCLVGLLLCLGDHVPRRGKIISAAVGLVLGIFAFQFILTDAHRERLMNINPFATPEAVGVRIEGSRSTETRVTTLAEALRIISEHPLTGVGLGNFRWVNAYLHGSYKPPHNSYVWSAAEGGIITTCLYLTLFGFLYTRVQRLRPKYKNHPQLSHLPDWLHLYLVLFFFFSIFADVWLEVHIYFIISIAIVLTRWALDEELRGKGLPGVVSGTPGARRAAIRQLYRPRTEAA